MKTNLAGLTRIAVARRDPHRSVMNLTRREFVATGLAGAAGLCIGSYLPNGVAAEAPAQLSDEDGAKLWLRYSPPDEAANSYRQVIRQIRVDGTSATSGVIREELRAAISALLGNVVPLNANNLNEGTVIVGTPGNSALVRGLNWAADLDAIGAEGFLIRSTRIENKPVTVIAANTDLGTLYGSFHLLRMMQTGQPLEQLDVKERPALQLRLVNHWDNPNGSIERGYAGRSLWQWEELPEKISPRYADYARACASIGLNGAVINNVNAGAQILAGQWHPSCVTGMVSVTNPGRDSNCCGHHFSPSNWPTQPSGATRDASTLVASARDPLPVVANFSDMLYHSKQLRLINPAKCDRRGRRFFSNVGSRHSAA